MKIVLLGVTGCDENSPWCRSTITGTGISDQTGIGVSDGSTVNLTAFTDNGGTDGATKTYTVTLENSVGLSDARTCSVEFTAGSSFACNSGNSAALSSMTVQTNKCYKYTVASSGNFYVGNWSGSGVGMTYTDCGGTPHTVTVANGNWTTYAVGGGCEIYAEFTTSAYVQFNTY